MTLDKSQMALANSGQSMTIFPTNNQQMGEKKRARIHHPLFRWHNYLRRTMQIWLNLRLRAVRSLLI